jgi:hypothetical protein
MRRRFMWQTSLSGDSRSLHWEDGEMPLELLPNLEELSYSGGHGGAFTPFINERKAAGCLVCLGQSRGEHARHVLTQPCKTIELT